MRPTALMLVLAAFLSPGCSSGAPQVAPASNPGAGLQEGRVLLLPAGLGTLHQDQISLRLQSGDLIIKVTPLDEGIIRLTAPDTYERLRSLVGIYGERAAGANSASPSSLFLVSLFSYKPDVIYEPEDLLLVNRGLRLRPIGIAPITPSWGTQRLGQQETRMAIYAFEGGIDWEADLVAEYQQLRNELWRDQVLPLVQAERAKVRARGGGAGSPWSRSISRP